MSTITPGLIKKSTKHATKHGYNVVYLSVSIKHGLQTRYKIRTRYKTRTGKYGLGIKHGQGIKSGLRTADCGLGLKYGPWTTMVKTVLIGSR